MWKALTSAVLICLLASPAMASDWTDVPWTYPKNSPVVRIQVDMESLTTTLPTEYHGPKKTFWLRRVHADGTKQMGHVTLDCKARSFVVDSGITYDKNGTGKNSYSGDFRSAPIPPDSDFDAARSMVCL